MARLAARPCQFALLHVVKAKRSAPGDAPQRKLAGPRGQSRHLCHVYAFALVKGGCTGNKKTFPRRDRLMWPRRGKVWKAMENNVSYTTICTIQFNSDSGQHANHFPQKHREESESSKNVSRWFAGLRCRALCTTRRFLHTTSYSANRQAIAKRSSTTNALLCVSLCLCGKKNVSVPSYLRRRIRTSPPRPSRPSVAGSGIGASRTHSTTSFPPVRLPPDPV